jgi:hypothetical protein
VPSEKQIKIETEIQRLPIVRREVVPMGKDTFGENSLISILVLISYRTQPKPEP